MNITEKLRQINARLADSTTVFDFTDDDYTVIKSLIDDLAGIKKYENERQALIFLAQSIEAARKMTGTTNGRKRRRAGGKVIRKFNATVRAIERGDSQNGV